MAGAAYNVLTSYNPWRIRKEQIRFIIKVWIQTQPKDTHEYWRSVYLQHLHDLDLSKRTCFLRRLLNGVDISLLPPSEVEERAIRNPTPKTDRFMKGYRKYGSFPIEHVIKDLRIYIQLWPKRLRSEIRDWLAQEISGFQFFPLEKDEYERFMEEGLPEYKERESVDGEHQLQYILPELNF